MLLKVIQVDVLERAEAGHVERQMILARLRGVEEATVRYRLEGRAERVGRLKLRQHTVACISMASQAISHETLTENEVLWRLIFNNLYLKH